MQTSASILAELLSFVQDAGCLALDLRARGLSIGYKESLGHALTEADLAISRLMHERFGPRLIEEETADGLSIAAARDLLGAGDHWTFIGDPIDGTAPFAGGLAGWGSMIAACKDGWPRVCAMILPAFAEDRDMPDQAIDASRQRGLLLAAEGGIAYWAPTLHGRMTAELAPLLQRPVQTNHAGWLPVAARSYTLDFHQGFFPVCEGSSVADAALLATGRLDVTTFNSKLWDLAPVLPVLEALGFSLYHWPGCEPPPSNIADLFDSHFACDPELWLVCRSLAQAQALGAAIVRHRPR